MAEEQDDLQSIMDSLEAPGGDRPMTVGEAPAPAETAPDPNSWRTSFDWNLDVNGQKIAVDSADKARTWMQQGYNYSQRAADLNRREQDWQQKLRQSEEKAKGFSKYDDVDKYARENPQWWSHVEQAWQSRAQQGQDPNIAPLLQRLQSLEGFVQQAQTVEQQRNLQQQDQALDTEIGEIRKSYPNIDLKAADETGRTLEWRVLNHANENGIQSFRAAFRDYLHDKLVEEAKAQGRVAIAQGQQTAAKKGLLGKSPTPTKAPRSVNHRGRSYDDLAAAALKEFGINS